MLQTSCFQSCIIRATFLIPTTHEDHLALRALFLLPQYLKIPNIHHNPVPIPSNEVHKLITTYFSRIYSHRIFHDEVSNFDNNWIFISCIT